MAEVKVRVTGDTTGFNAALTRARVGAAAFAGRMRSITAGIGSNLVGMFGTAAIGAAVAKTIRWADQLNDTSQRLDVNVEKLQAWEYAATQTGASLETLTGVIEKLKKAQQDAGRGNKSAKTSLAAFGITGADDVQTMLSKLARSAQSGDIQGKRADFQQVAGRGAGALIPALRQWEELAAEAERVGVIIKQEQVNVLEKLNDQFTFMSRFMMAELAPAIQWVSEKLIVLVERFKGLQSSIGEILGTLATPNNAANALGASFWENLSSGLSLTDAIKGVIADAVSGVAGAGIDALTPIVDAEKTAKEIIDKLRSGGATGAASDSEAPGLLKSRPVKAEVDSLARVGLFTASGLNGGPVLDIQRRQLNELVKIARNTEGDEGDPFQ